MAVDVPGLIPEGLDREALRITHVRGPMTSQVRSRVIREGGEAAWVQLLSRVSPECRDVFLRDIGVYEWVEARYSSELSLKYMAQTASDFTRQRGVEAAREQLTVLNRWLLKMMTPGFLLGNLPRLYNLYYRGGRVVLDEVGETQALLSLWADGFYPIWYQEGLPGWLSSALETTGAQGVKVTYVPPEKDGLLAFRHRYQLVWLP